MIPSKNELNCLTWFCFALNGLQTDQDENVMRCFCLCWGFTTQSTLWGHVCYLVLDDALSNIHKKTRIQAMTILLINTCIHVPKRLPLEENNILQIETGSLGFIETLQKLNWSLNHCLLPLAYTCEQNYRSGTHDPKRNWTNKLHYVEVRGDDLRSFMAVTIVLLLI